MRLFFTKCVGRSRILYALQCEASHRCCHTSGQSTKCSCNCHRYKLSTPVDDLYTAYTCIHIHVYTRSEHSHHNRSIIDEDVFVVAYFYVIRLSCCFAFGSIRCECAFFRRFICQLIYFDLNSHSLRNSQTSKWLRCIQLKYYKGSKIPMFFSFISILISREYQK